MLTRSGLGALVVAVLLIAAAWAWQYEELLIAAAVLTALVGMAVALARRKIRATVRRRVLTPRVARGRPVQLAIRVSNDTRHRSGAATLVDRCGDERVELRVPSLAPRASRDLTAELPTRRRGVFDVGPWVVERVDPFGLAVGSRQGDEVATVIVHPRIFPLVGPRGEMRPVESDSTMRRLATDPLSGFVSMREYVSGDDPRLIHWPTTARVGSLMVREHVELRRPEFTVVLDCAWHVGTPDDFEEAVDVAASIAVHAMRSALDVVLRTTNRRMPGRPTALTHEHQVLDLLTPIGQAHGDDLVAVPALFAGGPVASSLVLVTGPSGPSTRLAAGGPLSERMTTVRIGAGATVAPGVTLAAATAEEFAALWRPRASSDAPALDLVASTEAPAP